MFDYDAELVHYNARLRKVAAITADDHALDIGCGAGQTTRDAATAASSGSATGIDVSASMVDSARRLSEEAGLSNVTFTRGDAQTHSFAPEHFTVAISRFGTMFFTDPAAAFANIASALRPGARLVQLVWQAADRQEWVGEIRHALSAERSAQDGSGGGAFSLADPTVATGLLTAADFKSVEITDLREPIYYGADASGAHHALVGLGMVENLVGDLDATARTRALDRLLAVLDSHDTGEGVWFDSQVWLISARKR